MNVQLAEATRGLTEFCRCHTTLFIYGAGCLGRYLLTCLRKQGLTVTGFVVSDDQTAPEAVDGLPVYHCAELARQKRECGVVLALHPHEAEAAANVARLGIRDCRHLDWNERYAVEAWGLAVPVFSALQAAGVDIAADILDIGAYRFVNPLYNDLAELLPFLWEAGDLVLPFIGDCHLVDEGPYACGPVTVRPECGAVLDCGANIGLFSLYAAAQGCQVYAFEPGPAARGLLQRNAALYPDKVTIINAAVADYDGEAEFACHAEASNMDSLLTVSHAAYYGITAKITVPVMTIDAFVAETGTGRIGFIKADIEGAERQLLAGAARVLRKDAPQLALCTYHRPDDRSVLSQLILAANPAYHFIYGAKKLYAYVPDIAAQKRRGC